MADIGGTRFWRVDGKADYGALDELASQRLKVALIIQHWEDLLRQAGSLKLSTVQAAGLIRILQIKERPTNLHEIRIVMKRPALCVCLAHAAYDRMRSVTASGRPMGANPIGLSTIRVTKTFKALADELRERIIAGTIPSGSLLPNERELGATTGLSRGSVREALRELEAQGLVETRLGRNGGRVAQRPNVNGISQSLGFFVRGQRVEFKSLLETAVAIEPALAALAATHRKKSDLDALQRATAAMKAADGDPAQFNMANSAWHLVVASASHNPVLIAIMHSLGTLLHDPHVDDFTSDLVRAEVMRIHARIEAAIVAGDADAARRRMERHLIAYSTRVGPVAPKTITLD